MVGSGQPCIIAGDFDVEPKKVPCLLKGISAGLWVDLQCAWANASGIGPGLTCKRDLSCSGGSRRDFVLGCPLAAAALAGCWVDCNRWIQPHSPLWPASWVAAVEKTRTSKSAQVREIWEVYDKTLEFIPVNLAIAIRDALVERDASAAWTAWSNAAEIALSHAFCSAGGPIPPGGLVRGRGSAMLCKGVIGESRVRRLRSGFGNAAGASEVHLFRDISVAPILSLKGQLKAVHSLLESIALAGFTIERALQLNRQWDAIVSRGLTGVLDWDGLLNGPSFGLDRFRKLIADSIVKVTEFIQQVVLHRKDFAIRKWRCWVLEGPLRHHYRWLRPDNVPPRPFPQLRLL